MSEKTIIFFGRSGSGKGTQAELLIEYLKKQDSSPVLYIETGRILRERTSNPQYYSHKLVADVLRRGELLPEFVPIWAWSHVLMEEMKEDSHIIFDGLARRVDEWPILDSALQFYSREDVVLVNIEVGRRWSVDRLLERERKDDTRENIERRLDWFEEQTAPVLPLFVEDSRYKVITIDGEQTVEEVHKDIVRNIHD